MTLIDFRYIWAIYKWVPIIIDQVLALAKESKNPDIPENTNVKMDGSDKNQDIPENTN